MVSEIYSKLDFDYAAYTLDYMDRFARTLARYERERRERMSAGLPAHAEIVVIGGGIIGCSTAYHLARDHKADVVLIERGKLTGGSTWHAAGLVGQLRSSASITQVLRYSVDLYKRLEAETGLATGWRETGCLRLACNAERWTEFSRQATTAPFLRPRHAPPLARRSEGDVAADGGRRSRRRDFHAVRRPGEPVRHHSVARARARACTARSSSRASPAPVSRSRERPRRRGRDTTDGTIRLREGRRSAPACGRGRSARMAGVSVPLQPVKHQYVITEKIDGVGAGHGDASAIPTAAPISRRRSAASPSAATSRTRSPWTTGDVPEQFRVPAPRRRLGPFRAAHGGGARAHPGACAPPASSR